MERWAKRILEGEARGKPLPGSEQISQEEWINSKPRAKYDPGFLREGLPGFRPGKIGDGIFERED